MWQDIVITVCCFGFAISAMPTVLSKSKPPRSTSILMASLMTIIGICFGTLGLWLSMSAEFVAAIPWIIILIQTRR
jgi:hypothetical protein